MELFAGEAQVSQRRMTIDRLTDKVRTILLNDWDPIGVAGIPEAADEYDRYAAPIERMIAAGSPISELAEHLVGIEVDMMGLGGNPERARVVAAKLKRITREISTPG
jgi:hypothetical protein